MSRLRVFEAHAPDAPTLESHDGDAIARKLGAIGVTFERWQAAHAVEPGASQEAVLAAYRDDVARLVAQHGFRTVDVVSVAPDAPNKRELRAKFLEEHYHEEDEVRFFVAGAGLFTLHVGDEVYEIECTQGDLIAVPGRTTHWFDMGPEPSFVAIRFFLEPDGWVGHFTGSDIAQRFPRYGASP